MAVLGQWSGGVIGTMQPSTSLTAPNGLFPTEDRNDSSTYSWASTTSTVTGAASSVPDGYLLLAGYEHEDTSNGRSCQNATIVQTGGTGTIVSGRTGGYQRDTSEDRLYVSCWAFCDSPSASATFQFQWSRDTGAPNASDGTRRSYFQIIPFYYADIGLYSSTSASLYGGVTPNQVTGYTGTDGTNITITSNVVSVTGDNKRYLILGSQYTEGRAGRTQRWSGLSIDSTFDRAGMACVYYREGTSDETGGAFYRLIETVTATRTIEVNCYRGDGVAAGQGGADADGSTPAVGTHGLVVIELNDAAEVYSATDETGAQELALVGPVDINVSQTADEEFSDAASFLRVTDIAVNAEVAMDVLSFANISHAREANSIGSGTRWTVHGEFTLDGTEQTGVGFHGNYNRGNQGTIDTHGSSTNTIGAFALTLNQDIGVSNQELAGTEGGNGDIETQPGWVGFGLINLDTLVAGSSDTPRTPAVVAASLAGQAPTVVRADSVTPAIATTALAGQAPTVVRADVITPAVATTTLAGQAPTTVRADFVTPAVATAALAGQVPTAATDNNVAITPTAGGLNVTTALAVGWVNYIVKPGVYP